MAGPSDLGVTNELFGSILDGGFWRVGCQVPKAATRNRVLHRTHKKGRRGRSSIDRPLAAPGRSVARYRAVMPVTGSWP